MALCVTQCRLFTEKIKKIKKTRQSDVTLACGLVGQITLLCPFVFCNYLRASGLAYFIMSVTPMSGWVAVVTMMIKSMIPT